MNSNNSSSVIAVVISYNPDLPKLEQQLLSLSPQVGSIVIVDNGSVEDLEVWNASLAFGAEEVLPLAENLGIAEAQNRGIDWARLNGGKYVLLMDQDSLPDADMVRNLLESYQRLESQGVKVGVVGPRFRESPEATLSGFVRFSAPPGKRNVACSGSMKEVECEFVIASGSLISMDTFAKVGLMEGGLFIDQVDTEWCLRAASKGFSIYGVCDAIMQHDLGFRRKSLWFLRWREVPIHKPFRYYYIFRNSIVLRSRPYVDPSWKWFDLQRLLLIFILFGVLLPGRVSRLREMFRGALDGFSGVMGKRPD